jgi:hypothetical protein
MNGCGWEGFLTLAARLGGNPVPSTLRALLKHSPTSQRFSANVPHTRRGGGFSVPGLDYISCFLTITSTVLIGRRCWEGWALAAVNCVLISIIGLRTQQFGFIPANMFCLVLSGINVRAWRRAQTS